MKRLNKLYYMRREIEEIKEEIKNIPEISAINMSGMPHSTAISDTVYNLMLKKEKLVEKLTKKVELYTEELIKIENIIDGIEDDEIRVIARMRFIQHKKWAEIGEEMNFDRTSCSKKLRNYFKTKEVV